MIRLSLLLFSLTGFVNVSFSQSAIKEYIQKNVSAIRSIDPDDTQIDDLTIIGKAIGDARIVMMGEQDHGDAPTFEAKARIIKYLHEQLGFEVIAFESDFYSINREWDMVQKGHISIGELIEKNIFPIWTKCQQATGVFEYIKTCHAKNKNVVVTGFDSQMSMTYSQQNFKKEVNEYLVGLNLSFVSSSKYTTQFLPFIDSVFYYSKNTELLKTENNVHSLIFQLDSILNQLRDTKHGNDLRCLALENLKAQCRMLIFRKQGKFPASMEVRDRQMADNLAWLANVKYPTKKIIVWAASYHIIKDKNDKIRHLTMGYYIAKEHKLANATYVLGFVSYSGTAGSIYMKPYEFNSSEKESVEEWIHQKKYDYAFIDFKIFRKANPNFNKSFYMAGVRHLQQETNWIKSFDGVFYLKNMYPCNIKQ